MMKRIVIFPAVTAMTLMSGCFAVAATAEAAGNGPKPVVRWRFDGDDSSPVVLKGAKLTPCADRGTSLSFDGPDDRAEAKVPRNVPDPMMTDRPFTMMLRVRPVPGLVPSSVAALAKMTGSRTINGFMTAMGDGGWHHLAISFDPAQKGKEYKAYFDWPDPSSPSRFLVRRNRDDGLTQCILPFKIESGKATFGGQVGWGMFSLGYRGLVDDVMIFDTALKDDEVKRLGRKTAD